MTCQDNCLYYPLCRDSGFLMYHTRIKKTITLTENVEKECPFKKFKNKAEFVEVVRCKDCKHRFDYCTRIMCDKNARRINEEIVGLVGTLPDHFCCYGERRAEE